MPTVSRYGQRKVVTEALPGVRKSAAETATSMGAGLAEAQGRQAQAIGELGATVTHIATRQIAEMEAEERKRADDVAAMEYDTALGQWGNKRVYDPETGALTVKGKDAMVLPEQVLGEFDQIADAHEQGMNPRQLAQAKRIRAQHAQNLNGTLYRHTFREKQEYDAGVVQATVETAYESAVANASDPRRVGVELHKGITAIQLSAKPQGWSPEVVAKKVGDMQSATHTAVIERLLDDKLTMEARVYFEEKGAEITDPKARARVTDMLKVGQTKADGQKLADTISAEGGTLTEQLAKVKAQAEGDVRDDAQRRLEHLDAQRKASEREADESLLDTVYARLKQNGGDLSSLTASEQVKLGRHLPGLTNFSQDLARGVPRKSDEELDQILRAPIFHVINLTGSLGLLVILYLMIFKPGLL